MASAALPIPASRPAPSPLAITCVVMIATFLQVLDSTIANVALPHMQASLGAAADTVTWVLTSYIVASAIATPLTGWLSGMFGRKKLFVAAIAGFILASMACGAAQSLEQMVAFRLMQGAFGAFLVPLGQSFLLDAYPREKHGQALALWGVGVMVGPVMGPVLGGWLTDSFDWRWVFYVNVPFGALALFGALAFLPESSNDKRRRFDVFGFAMLSIGVGALQLMLDRGQQLDWLASWEVRVEGGLAIAALWMFGVHVMTGRDTILDSVILRDRNAMTGFVFITLIGGLMVSTSALMPPMLEGLYGYPVVTAGLAMAPRGIGTMAGMLLMGKIIGKFDPRHLMAFGLLLTAWSLWMMSHFSPVMGMREIVISGLVQGFGLGFLFVPLNTMAFATLGPAQRTDAASFFSLLRNLGASVGVSLGVGVLATQTQIAHSDIGSAVTPFSLGVDSSMVRALGPTGDAAMAFLDAQVNMQAAMVAYLDVYYLLMWVTLGTLPLLLLMRRPGKVVGEIPHAAVD
ncbi:DHA2 family efflux MFS transporter permease subunit [Glacieibacterium sp.]|uniref:DHA2 family efflux MFS transporter permease subunit n=1 Tax=Glacieibacterium sp. TaxID=2860237 RepID=UPI003B0045BE